jgi:hypothetical protein
MSFEDGEDLVVFGTDPVDDSVRSPEDLTHILTPDLWHDAACARQRGHGLRRRHQDFDPSGCRDGVVLGNVVADLAKVGERTVRPDDIKIPSP